MGATNQTAATAQPLRTMLLDDDDFMLEFIGDMLRDMGHSEVFQENSATSALDSIMQHNPDLLICDLCMPDMDGIEFLRFVAEKGFKGSVVLHSSMDGGVLKAAERLAQAHGLHVLGSFEKPITQESLLASVEQLGQFTLRQRAQAVAPPASAPTALTLDELKEGLAAEWIELYYQPKVSVHGRKMLAVECLARWRHPQRGVLPPSAFIAQIEEYGLIDEFTLLVLKIGARQMGQWLREGHDFKIAVNVSMDNLNRLDLPEVFQKVAHDAGVDTRNIVLEMTETRLMDNMKVSLEILTRLRLKGFGLSIDDFGTGFSTMENLKKLPFNELKIDRAFVDGASADSASRSILESSIRLGKIFHLKLVAEGVETEQDWDLITASGCDEVQGYFVAKPMPAGELIAWKQRWERGEEGGGESDGDPGTS